MKPPFFDHAPLETPSALRLPLLPSLLPPNCFLVFRLFLLSPRFKSSGRRYSGKKDE